MAHRTVVCPECNSRPWQACPRLYRRPIPNPRDKDALLQCTRHRLMVAKRELTR